MNNKVVMKIDLEYTKDLLDLIVNDGAVDFNIGQDHFLSLQSDDGKKNKLAFHLEILADQGYIENSCTKGNDIGVQRFGLDTIKIKKIPLRLTASGHQFASDLGKSGVIDTLTRSFKDAGPSEVIKIVCALAKQIADKKLASFLDESN
ncbi:DUF2513 domain-containing protein [Aliivibrio fischeri]|uniref:DUF2513 domain-containing protein n=1 Tax=Aliivibrio fischeri TaxID=668 RepID=A0A6N3Z6Y6_ALIFS|nr:DUF2513 domain-containing protein [Aliivibrio fischeri]MUK47554.1 DUF2513 domain-containing protein [Aliivibrio fischeri]MUK81544.1 DUF2513 domain-containing protein [Aliivibrio fischeri]MUK86590.1 DUF2513 domain-containing protein [Aliivibrio fischeri]